MGKDYSVELPDHENEILQKYSQDKGMNPIYVLKMAACLFLDNYAREICHMEGEK